MTSTTPQTTPPVALPPAYPVTVHPVVVKRVTYRPVTVHELDHVQGDDRHPDVLVRVDAGTIEAEVEVWRDGGGWTYLTWVPLPQGDDLLQASGAPAWAEATRKEARVVAAARAAAAILRCTRAAATPPPPRVSSLPPAIPYGIKARSGSVVGPGGAFIEER